MGEFEVNNDRRNERAETDSEARTHYIGLVERWMELPSFFELMSAPFEERARLATQCGEMAAEARQGLQMIGEEDAFYKPKFKKRELQALAMQTMLTPERANMTAALETADSLHTKVDLETTDPHEYISNNQTWYDLLAFDAFTTARQAETDTQKEVSRAMLQAILIEQMHGMVHVLGALDSLQDQSITGKLIEPMMVIWERFNILRYEAVDTFFVRSALVVEDNEAKYRTQSTDALVVHVGGEDEASDMQYVQYKSTKRQGRTRMDDSSPRYHPDIEVLKIYDRDKYLNNLDAVEVYMRQALESESSEERGTAMRALDAFMPPSTVKRMHEAKLQKEEAKV